MLNILAGMCFTFGRETKKEGLADLVIWTIMLRSVSVHETEYGNHRHTHCDGSHH
ncbi:hypothetical protein BURPSPAST_Y0129 [Burkholderia pseudomallei Pasteur 52237]|nr:hypothetical protein BURPSPAST_Y0129 [Burkholderia pseudomallei Pasteur 52237]